MGRKEFEDYKCKALKRLEELEKLLTNKKNHLIQNSHIINESLVLRENIMTCYEVSKFYDVNDPVCEICGVGSKEPSMKSCAKNPLANRYRIG